MGDILSTKEFAELHSVTLRTARNWIKAGLPTMEGRVNHQPAKVIDNDKATEWLVDRNKITDYMKAQATKTVKSNKVDRGTIKRIARKSAEDNEKYFDPAKAKMEIDSNLLSKFGLEAALERIKWLEAKIFETLMDNIVEESNALPPKTPEEKVRAVDRRSSIATLQALQTKITPVLKELEMNYLEYQKKKSILIDSREVASLWAAIAVGIKEAMMGVGNKVSPFLRPYLNKSGDINIVKDIIDNAVREGLQSLDENKVPLRND